MNDEPKSEETGQRDDLALLLRQAKEDPAVAAAMLGDLEALIQKQGLSVDTQSAAYQELLLRLYHARVVLHRNLDDLQNRLAAGLLAPAGEGAFYAAPALAADLSARPAPYLAAAHPADLAATYLAAGHPQAFSAPYLAAPRPQDLRAPYLTAARPQDLSAPYLAAARPQDLAAPYLTAARPQDLSAPYLTAARALDLAAPYLTAPRPLDLSAPYLTAARPQDLSADDYARLKAEILAELRQELTK